METHWYRAFFRVQAKSAMFDMDGEFCGFTDKMIPQVTIYYDSFPILKHTPQGVWLANDEGKRFVLRDARKRWACPTKGEAFESLVARTKRRKKILKSQLRDVDYFLDPGDEVEWDEIHLSEGGYYGFT